VPNAEDAAGELKEIGEEFLTYMYKEAFGDSGQAVFADIFASSNVLLWSCLSALVLGYLFLFVIRCIGGLIIYVFLLVLLACLGFGGLYVKMDADSRDDADSYKQYMYYGAYTLWGLAGIEALCVCCCWSAIKIAIAVYKTTAQYVASNLRILLLPLLSWVALVLWFAVWTVCALYVGSVGTVAPREGLPFLSEVAWDENTRYVFWY
jgi:solute carrier family 44 (choline transporter-like protein), member 1